MKTKKTLQLPNNMQLKYCVTLEDMEEGCQLLNKRFLDSPSDCIACSFDCEWKINYQFGSNNVNKVSLIQINYKNLIILFHIKQYGLCNSLIHIIKSVNYIKIGVNINNDIRKLERDYPLIFEVGSIKGVCDLRKLSEVTGVPPQRSLAGNV